MPQPLAPTLPCTQRSRSLSFARLTGDSVVELHFHLHLPNYERGWAAPRVLCSHLYFLPRDGDDLNMMARWNSFSWQSPPGLNLPVSSILVPRLPKGGGGTLGRGQTRHHCPRARSDSHIQRLKVQERWLSELTALPCSAAACWACKG